MPVTIITDKATHNIKQGSGTINNIVLSNGGSAWTLQINDGPDSAGNVQNLIGKTPTTLPTSAWQPFTNPFVFPIAFRDGLQVVTAGTTAGEIAILWE